MMERADVERGILDEEVILDELARLLESRSDFTAWPQDMTTALALALEDGSMSRPESWKAVTLRRHLFGPAGVVPHQLAGPRQPSALDRKRAERLRSGLPACVRYRAGMYLLQASP
jgi:hypothetical protein